MIVAGQPVPPSHVGGKVWQVRLSLRFHTIVALFVQCRACYLWKLWRMPSLGGVEFRYHVIQTFCSTGGGTTGSSAMAASCLARM